MHGSCRSGRCPARRLANRGRLFDCGRISPISIRVSEASTVAKFAAGQQVRAPTVRTTAVIGKGFKGLMASVWQRDQIAFIRPGSPRTARQREVSARTYKKHNLSRYCFRKSPLEIRAKTRSSPPEPQGSRIAGGSPETDRSSQWFDHEPALGLRVHRASPRSQLAPYAVRGRDSPSSSRTSAGSRPAATGQGRPPSNRRFYWSTSPTVPARASL